MAEWDGYQWTERPERVRRPLKPCADCGWIHDPAAVVAVDRFRPEGPSGYRTADGVIHQTREAGQAHICRARKQEQS